MAWLAATDVATAATMGEANTSALMTKLRKPWLFQRFSFSLTFNPLTLLFATRVRSTKSSNKGVDAKVLRL